MTDFEKLRTEEFSRLDDSGHVYLDYTGSALYPVSLVRNHADFLCRSVFGNPHSHNPSASESTRQVEKCRSRVLDFFGADPDEYEIIFACNATGGLKLLAESYPFAPGSVLLMTADNHNSVNGIREYARRGGAEVVYIELNDRLGVDSIQPALRREKSGSDHLFCFPAQSNFSGVKHPLEWVAEAREAGYDVLLDAAAFAPTNRMNMAEIGADFACVSFYKMFGYPTGIGALLARREALAKLRRPWFAGGTAEYASATPGGPPKEPVAEAFEDGTINFLNVCAVAAGLDFLDAIGMERLNRHVMALTGRLIERLSHLAHSSGEPLVCIYGPSGTEGRGATVALNVLDPNGRVIDCELVEERASEGNISLRTGGFCNPGASETAFHSVDPGTFADADSFCPDEAAPPQPDAECSVEEPSGAVRVSFGMASNERDVERFIAFLGSFRDVEAGVSRRDEHEATVRT